jgi:excisionase family DNA binding protein
VIKNAYNPIIHESAHIENNSTQILTDYPDVLNIEQLSRILGVSTKTIYNLLKNGYIECLKVGRSYRVPKIYLINYLGSASKMAAPQYC